MVQKDKASHEQMEPRVQFKSRFKLELSGKEGKRLLHPVASTLFYVVVFSLLLSDLQL